MSEQPKYAGLMGERLAPPSAEPTTTTTATPRRHPPLEPLPRPEAWRVRVPGVPSAPAGGGTIALLVLAAVALLIALGRLGGPPAPLPPPAPVTSEVQP